MKKVWMTLMAVILLGMTAYFPVKHVVASTAEDAREEMRSDDGGIVDEDEQAIEDGQATDDELSDDEAMPGQDEYNPDEEPMPETESGASDLR